MMSYTAKNAISDKKLTEPNRFQAEAKAHSKGKKMFAVVGF